jgi:hypothetical protein
MIHSGEREDEAQRGEIDRLPKEELDGQLSTAAIGAPEFVRIYEVVALTVLISTWTAIVVLMR